MSMIPFVPAPGRGALRRSLRRLALLALAPAAACGDPSSSGRNPVPQITSVSPATLQAGDPPATVTVTGRGFAPEAEVVVHEGGTRPSTYVSPTELRVPLTAEDMARGGTIELLVINPPPGGGGSNRVSVAVVNPAPAITSVSSVEARTESAVAVVTGTGFVATSSVFVGESHRPFQPVSRTELRVPLTAGDVDRGGTVQIRVENPAPGGGSATAAMEVRNPVPVATAFLDGSAVAGGPGRTIAINGSGFAANAQVRVNGDPRFAQSATSSQVQATLSAADLAVPGTLQIRVFNPGPGGGLSNAIPFVVEHPVAELTSLSPTFAPTGGAGATVTVRGTRFFPHSRVTVTQAPEWGVRAERPTTYVSATELRVALPASDLAAAGHLVLHVRNPQPGGGMSNDLWLGLHAPVPVATSLAPAFTGDLQESFLLRVNGTKFVANSEVRFDHAPRPTRRVSATQLEATLSSADLRQVGTFPITVTNPGPAGGTSQALDFEVRAPAPTLTSLGATQTTAGQESFRLRVNGTGFRPGSFILVNDDFRFTSLLGTTALETTLYGSDLAAARTLRITVFTGWPGGGLSNMLPFQVVAPPPSASRSR